MAITAQSATCPTCGWFRHDDGVCRRCAAGDVVAAPCPPHAEWPRDLKVRLFDTYLLTLVQVGTPDERRQRAWEKIADVVARELRLIHDYVTPPAIALERLTEHFNRPARTGTEG